MVSMRTAARAPMLMRMSGIILLVVAATTESRADDPLPQHSATTGREDLLRALDNVDLLDLLDADLDEALIPLLKDATTTVNQKSDRGLLLQMPLPVPSFPTGAPTGSPTSSPTPGIEFETHTAAPTTSPTPFSSSSSPSTPAPAAEEVEFFTGSPTGADVGSTEPARSVAPTPTTLDTTTETAAASGVGASIVGTLLAGAGVVLLTAVAAAGTTVGL